MARTDLTAITVKSGKDAYTATTLTSVAADTTNFNAVALTGKEILIARNSGASAYTVTITSVADPVYGRTGDISAVSIPAGESRMWGPFPLEGWRQADNKLYFQANNAAVLFTVIRLP